MAALLPIKHVSGIDQRIAGGELVVDLDALKANYRNLSAMSAPARTAGVVKANAYGLGVEQIVPALLDAGCRTFFVAAPHEGIAVRGVAPDAEIFVLNGLGTPDAVPFFFDAKLIPVLNSPGDIAMWEAHGHRDGQRAPCAVHVDTGMNRLGLSMGEARSLSEENRLTQALDIRLVMSHLACADTASHPLNTLQGESFQHVTALFEGIESSLDNAEGITLGPDFRHDLTRPGIALYGGALTTGPANPMRPVASLSARVLQVRRGRAGETVGYGATVKLTHETTIAIVGVGYADGYPRSLSGSGVPLREADRPGAFGHLHGKRVPVIGRVSMDLTAFDVTELGPDAVQAGDMIELFGANMPIAEVAVAAGTIPYEILTSIGDRFHRRTIGKT